MFQCSALMEILETYDTLYPLSRWLLFGVSKGVTWRHARLGWSQQAIHQMHCARSCDSNHVPGIVPGKTRP